MGTNQGHTIEADLPEDLTEKWQNTLNVLAELMGVPAALVMRLKGEDIEVFVASNTESNPYKRGDREHFENSGLYCETVIKNDDKLIVPNALKDKDWNTNPDIKLGMIAYMGFPVHYPDGTPFGTICVLDREENPFGELREKVLERFRELLELHLALHHKNRELGKSANTDPLTELYNRRFFDEIFQKECSRHQRTGEQFCVILGDLDGFKKINDIYGHSEGDQALIRVAEILKSETRMQDFLFRWGGDEFLVLLPETTIDEGVSYARRVLEAMGKNSSTHRDYMSTLSMSFGVTGVLPGEKADSVLIRCDRQLYRAKALGRGEICFDDVPQDR
ncbi:MAG: diguanylate cyclase [Thermovirgaceae bacterium]